MIGAMMLALGAAPAAAGDDALVVYKSLSPEVALEAAQAALKKCRDNGFQIAVAVVDRFGQPQVMLRDRFAGSHAPDTATRKAYTAVSFRTATSELAKSIRSGQLDPGLAQLPHVAMLGGGLMIEAGGTPARRHRRLRRARRRQGRGVRQGGARCHPRQARFLI